MEEGDWDIGAAAGLAIDLGIDDWWVTVDGGLGRQMEWWVNLCRLMSLSPLEVQRVKVWVLKVQKGQKVLRGLRGLFEDYHIL